MKITREDNFKTNRTIRTQSSNCFYSLQNTEFEITLRLLILLYFVHGKFVSVIYVSMYNMVKAGISFPVLCTKRLHNLRQQSTVQPEHSVVVVIIMQYLSIVQYSMDFNNSEIPKQHNTRINNISLYNIHLIQFKLDVIV